MLQLRTTNGAKIAIDADHIAAVEEQNRPNEKTDGCIIHLGNGAKIAVTNHFLDVYERWLLEITLDADTEQEPEQTFTPDPEMSTEAGSGI